MPTGAGTYGRFLAIRVFDFWVHECDITTPLGRVTDDAGVEAEIALAEVESSIGYIVGKKVGLPDRKSIAFCLTGPLVRELDVIVDGRAKQVDHLDDPDVYRHFQDITYFVCGHLAYGNCDSSRVCCRGLVWGRLRTIRDGSCAGISGRSLAGVSGHGLGGSSLLNRAGSRRVFGVIGK